MVNRYFPMVRMHLFLLLLGAGCHSMAQESPRLSSLIVLGDSILKGSTDSVRLAAHDRFKTRLESILLTSGSYDLDFSAVTNLSVLSSSDGRIRVYTWLLPSRDGIFAYHGFIQAHDPKTEYVTTLGLKEAPLQRNEAEKRAYDYTSWIGALYYDIITVKDRRKPYYTLLGWRRQPESNMKVIEALSVDKGKAVFGKPVFETDFGRRYRILFEYHPRAMMTLRYEPGDRMIMFDHLSPPDSSLAGHYPSYGPDFTYDAFRLSRNKWKLMTNIEPRNRTGTRTNPDAEKIRNKEFYRPLQDQKGKE